MEARNNKYQRHKVQIMSDLAKIKQIMKIKRAILIFFMKTILKQKENRSFQANSNALNDMNFANTEMKNMKKAKE